MHEHTCVCTALPDVVGGEILQPDLLSRVALSFGGVSIVLLI
jgi:hypothetical protein